MIKRLILWGLTVSAAGVAYAQDNDLRDNNTALPDSCAELSERVLDEVTVKTSAIITKTDRKLIVPSDEQTRTATDGLDLLRKLQLPGISINPMTGNIVLARGGNIVLLINGVTVTDDRLTALSPEDIIRVEYHDNPGVRYADADVVIDFITRRHDNGGNIHLDSFDAIGSGKWASISNLSAQYTDRASTWTLTSGYFGLHRDNWVRDYDEVWHYPDHDVTRTEKGMPVSIGGSTVDVRLNYNYRPDDRHTFDATIGFTDDYTPNKEEGDRHTLLYSSDSDAPIEIREHTRERGTKPTLDLYYGLKLDDRQQLTAEAAAAWLHSNSLHSYSEALSDSSPEEILSRVKGDNVTFGADLIYENRYRSQSITAGLRQTTSLTDNRYADTGNAAIKVTRTESAAFGEYSNRFGLWGVTASASAVWLHSSQNHQSIHRLGIDPSASLSFKPSPQWFVRYSFDLTNKLPPVAALSDVTQEIQPGLVRRGNPRLKPYTLTDHQLSASFSSSFLNVDLNAGYNYQHNPVMETTVYEDPLFVHTFANQRSFSVMNIGATVATRLWDDHISIALMPQLNRYFSHGNTFSHAESIFRLGVAVDFTYGPWLFYVNTMSGAANTMSGEEIIEEKDMNMIMAGYQRNHWSIHAGVFNAFMKEYWMKTRNLSELTPFTSRAHCGKNSYFAIKFSLDLNFGRQAPENTRQAKEFDSESGIVNGLK